MGRQVVLGNGHLLEQSVLRLNGCPSLENRLGVDIGVESRFGITSGEPVSFRGVHLEDYMSDHAKPWSFRLDPVGGHGAVADIGSPIISIARHLMGEIESRLW